MHFYIKVILHQFLHIISWKENKYFSKVSCAFRLSFHSTRKRHFTIFASEKTFNFYILYHGKKVSIFPKSLVRFAYLFTLQESVILSFLQVKRRSSQLQFIKNFLFKISLQNALKRKTEFAYPAPYSYLCFIDIRKTREVPVEIRKKHFKVPLRVKNV